MMPEQHFYDIAFMQRAIELAKQGRFTTTPNPNVGCVITKNNQTIGEGFHYKAGLAHAEVHALKMAGKQAKDATAYVTLEPCSHFGKTPPCANALIESGIKRVCIAMLDSNPQVAGRGVELLKSAGIEVQVGILAEQAEEINKGFLKRMRTGLPYVQVKMGASIDGKIAMASGESQWITSPESRQDVQVFRAQSSVILSSSATVLADDPSLTVRWNELPESIQAVYPESQVRQPIRVIVDSQNRVPKSARIFQQPGEIWLVNKQPNDASNNLNNVTQLIEPSKHNSVDLVHLLSVLGEKQINTVWVEAGSSFAGALIEADLVDELIIYMAPKLLGSDAKGVFKLANIHTLKEAPQFTFSDITQIGPDVRMILRK